MYLPRIVIERFGWAGFLVFALPNVLFCAGFGYMVRTGERSRAWLATQETRPLWFSTVTIAYHLFFAAFLLMDRWPTDAGALDALPLQPMLGATIPIFIAAAANLLRDLSDTAWRRLGACAWLASAALAISSLLGDAPLHIPVSREVPSHALLLAPVIALGFFASPWFDLTFHRALQRSPSVHSFAIFGVGFAMMIVATVAFWFRPTPMAQWTLVTHLLVQSIFTVGAHARERRTWWAANPGARGAGARNLHLVATWAPVLFFLALRAAKTEALRSLGEDTYLRFLGFYGLIAPIWLFFGNASRLSRRSRRVMVAAIALSAPLLELAFIHPYREVGIIVALIIALGAAWTRGYERRHWATLGASRATPSS